MYSARIIFDRLPIDIVEIVSLHQKRTLRVTQGKQNRWDIELSRWYAPSVALLPDGALGVWASTRLYLLVTDEAPRPMDFDDEVHAVFAVDGKLLVVTELSVALVDPSTGQSVDRFDAEDVLGGAWWRGDDLEVEQPGRPSLWFRPRKGSLNQSPPRP